jgi:hypothetical protein
MLQLIEKIILLKKILLLRVSAYYLEASSSADEKYG